MSTHKIEVKLIGSIDDYFLRLEETPITLNPASREWTGNLEVDGEMRIQMACRSKNKNDKSCTLEVKVDGQGPKKYTRQFKKRLAVVSRELALPI